MLETIPVRTEVDHYIGIDYSLIDDPVVTSRSLDMHFRVRLQFYDAVFKKSSLFVKCERETNCDDMKILKLRFNKDTFQKVKQIHLIEHFEFKRVALGHVSTLFILFVPFIWDFFCRKKRVENEHSVGASLYIIPPDCDQSFLDPTKLKYRSETLSVILVSIFCSKTWIYDWSFLEPSHMVRLPAMPCARMQPHTIMDAIFWNPTESLSFYIDKHYS